MPWRAGKKRTVSEIPLFGQAQPYTHLTPPGCWKRSCQLSDGCCAMFNVFVSTTKWPNGPKYRVWPFGCLAKSIGRRTTANSYLTLVATPAVSTVCKSSASLEGANNGSQAFFEVFDGAFLHHTDECIFAQSFPIFPVFMKLNTTFAKSLRIRTGSDINRVTPVQS